MAVLLEIDPNADKDSALAVGVEESYGVPAPVMSPLGIETVFNLALLKKHYDALGNHLHVPTLKQAQVALPQPPKLRARCSEVAAVIESALASPVWNVTLGNFAEMNCENCGAVVRKRMPHGKEQVATTCFECNASYTITDTGGGAVTWQLDMVDVACGDPACGHLIHILKTEFERGSTWECPACKGKNTLELQVAFEPISPQ